MSYIGYFRAEEGTATEADRRIFDDNGFDVTPKPLSYTPPQRHHRKSSVRVNNLPHCVSFKVNYLPHCVSFKVNNLPHCVSFKVNNLPHCVSFKVNNLPHCVRFVSRTRYVPVVCHPLSSSFTKFGLSPITNIVRTSHNNNISSSVKPSITPSISCITCDKGAHGLTRAEMSYPGPSLRGNMSPIIRP
ncbi:hypothetical protein J6590_084443 [Homalodisca vitripennis]|nr:hypothetical protein J6590_084443 [Homalodisca vitripennis]